MSTTEQQQQQQLYSNSSSRQDSDITHEFLHEYIKTIKVSVADLWNAWQASTLEFPGTIEAKGAFPDVAEHGGIVQKEGG